MLPVDFDLTADDFFFRCSGGEGQSRNAEPGMSPSPDDDVDESQSGGPDDPGEFERQLPTDPDSEFVGVPI